MNIYIHKPVIYSDMQGPCASGFHVPTKSEWEGLKTIMNGLSLTTGDNWRINLHMPFAGNLKSSNGTLDNKGTIGYYWSSSCYGGSTSRNLYINSSSVIANNYNYVSEGFNVRSFKNSFVVPANDWTVINGTLGGAGIFWNQTDGIISITSNGTTGYTIQDKNLGATSVYNNGDTLTDANMGNMYQWGNNYGFTPTTTPSRTDTRVDASNYGPGNYYSSSIFIYSWANWSSVDNPNLRGGVSGAGGENELKNIYIGEYKNPERIEYKMNADSSGNLYIPTSGIGHNGDYGPSYSWKVSVDGGAETTLSGTGSNGGVITLIGYYTANTEHLIKITPVTEEYGWALAYGWSGNSKRFSLTEVVYDSSYMGYADSATNTGDYFRYGQYRNCNITSAPYEYLPDTVTTIGAYYRGEQYRECSKLTSSPEESLPNSVTSIGNYFRLNQYYSCNRIAEIKGWKDLSIGSTGYRASQYYIQPNTGATVKVLSDVGWHAANAYALLNAYTALVYVPSAYLNNFKNFSRRPWSDIDDSKFIGY